MAAGRFFWPQRVWISIVLLGLIGAGAVIWHLSRPDDKDLSSAKEYPHAQTSGEAIGQPQGRPPRRRLIPGVDFPFEVKKAHVNKDGRIINPNDCDGDGLPDDWEMRRYGTLKYRSRTHRNALRIDRPPWKPDPEDTDGDSLPDKWEMKYFGHLRYDRYDDPDEDGWPNHMEYSMQKEGWSVGPTQLDMSNPEGRPKRYYPYNKRAFSTLTAEFWRKQDAARQKLLRQGGNALVRARRMKRVRRAWPQGPATKATTAPSTRPSG